MIELRRLDGPAGTEILEVSCIGYTPDDVFTRFVRIKVSMENLLPAASILQTPHTSVSGEVGLRWCVGLGESPRYLTLIRAALDVLGLRYRDGAMGQPSNHGRELK